SALIQAVRQKNVLAAYALSRIGPGPSAVPALREALKDTRSPVVGVTDESGRVLKTYTMRYLAARTLGTVGKDARAAVPDLRKALDGPDETSRRYAAGT